MIARATGGIRLLMLLVLLGCDGSPEGSKSADKALDAKLVDFANSRNGVVILPEEFLKIVREATEAQYSAVVQLRLQPCVQRLGRSLIDPLFHWLTEDAAVNKSRALEILGLASKVGLPVEKSKFEPLLRREISSGDHETHYRAAESLVVLLLRDKEKGVREAVNLLNEKALSDSQGCQAFAFTLAACSYPELTGAEIKAVSNNLISKPWHDHATENRRARKVYGLLCEGYLGQVGMLEEQDQEKLKASWLLDEKYLFIDAKARERGLQLQADAKVSAIPVDPDSGKPIR